MNRRLQFESMEYRRLLASVAADPLDSHSSEQVQTRSEGQASSPLGSPLDADYGGLSIERGIFGDLQLVLEGPLPQRVRLVSASGDLLQDAWFYDSYVPLTGISDGQYRVQVAISSTPWLNYRLSIESGDGTLAEIHSQFVELEGSLPRRVVVTDASGAVVYDHYHYDRLFSVYGFPEGDYGLQHASSGQSWQQQLLRVGTDSASLEDLPNWQIEFPDSTPRLVTIADESGRLLLYAWHYGQTLDFSGYDSGSYVVHHAVSGESSTVLDVVLDDSGIQVRDVTPVSRKVFIDGTFPSEVRIYDAQNQVVWEAIIASSSVSLDFLPVGEYVVYHHHDDGDEWAVEVEIAETETNVGTVFRPIVLHGVSSSPVEVTDAQGVRLAFYENPPALLPLNEFDAPFQRFVYSDIDGSRRVIEARYVDGGWDLHDLSNSLTIYLGGSTPRYVQVVAGDGEVRSEGWQYNSTLDISSFAAGEYLVKHASSGQPFNLLAVTKQNGSAQVHDFANEFQTILVADLQAQVIMELLEFGETDFRVYQPPKIGSLISGEDAGIQTYRYADTVDRIDWFIYRTTGTSGEMHQRLIRLELVEAPPPALSYFVPGIGTVDVAIGMPSQLERHGSSFASDFVVINQYGASIDYVTAEGDLKWRTTVPVGMSSVEVEGEYVVFTNGNSVGFLSLEDGSLQRTWTVGDDTAWVRFVNPLGDNEYLIGRESISGIQTIEIWSTETGIVWTNPHDGLWPRWAAIRGDLLVVADTFNHRIYAVDLDTDEMVFEFDVIYPNDVRFVTDDLILVTEEHADRVWTLRLSDFERELVLAAPGLEDLQLTVTEMNALVNQVGRRINPEDTRSKSVSSVEYAGSQTLYSPNGAVPLADGSYYVADTDNHRVVHVSALGEVLAEIVGFNNPVKLSIVPD